MGTMKETEFYGTKISVEDSPLGLYLLENSEDKNCNVLVYGERDASYFELIAKQVPKEDFIQTLKQVLFSLSNQLEEGMNSVALKFSPEKDREHNFEALQNTKKVLSEILKVLSEKS